MGYEVRQYKLTAADAAAINGSRPNNWYQKAVEGDEHPMIIMGKVLLDGETSYWVNPNALPPVAAPAMMPKPVAQSPVIPPVQSIPQPPTPPVQEQKQVLQPVPQTPSGSPIAPPASLTPEQHAVLAAAGVPASPVH